MPWKPGESGNISGLQNAEYYDVLTMLVKRGHNHIDAIITIAQDPEVKTETRLKANEMLLARTSPILKTVEQKMDEGLKEQFARLKDEMIAICDDYRREY